MTTSAQPATAPLNRIATRPQTCERWEVAMRPCLEHDRVAPCLRGPVDHDERTSAAAGLPLAATTHPGGGSLSRKNAILAALALLSAVLLSGCLSAPERQAFNHAAVPELRSIAVLPMRTAEPTVTITNHPGNQFGLIGALVAAGHMAPKQDRLRKQLADVDFSQSRILRDALDGALREYGYDLQWPEPLEETEKATRDRWGRRKTIAAIEGVDAQLDISINYLGYAAAGALDSTPYRPTLTLSARLVAADGKTILFQDTFIHNNVFNIPHTVIVNPDPRFTYADSEVLDEAGAEIVDGLCSAVEAVAKEIAEQLRT